MKLNLRWGLLALVLCCLTLNDICAAQNGLVVTGDVARELVLSGYEGLETVSIEYRGAAQEVIPLLSVLEQAGVLGEGGHILLTAYDGVAALLSLEEITENCYLRLSPEYGWQFLSESHPPQARLKFLEYLVVMGLGPDVPALRFIHGLQERVITYGGLFTVDAVQRLVMEGEARKGDFSVTAFTRRSLIPLEQLVEAGDITAGLAYFADGGQMEVSLQGYLEWRGTSADYLGEDGRSRKPDIRGIWVDPPKLSITELLPQALAALEEGSVLIILLDGLGYLELQRVQPPFLSCKGAEQARSVFPSITPVALGSILTGELPSKHGVTARGMRDLKVPDLFDHAAQLGRESAMVEGTTKVLNTSIRQILNPDLDGDGSTDNEVFAAAREQLEKGVDLVFVHFHGYDDVAHAFGPFSPEAAEKLLELDRYVQQLCQDFSGTVFVLADHGQHPATGDKLGDHGQFSLLDLTIPWLKWVQP